MEFSNQIIQARKSKCLSQEALADLIGVSRQAISKWETGEAKPDVDNLIILCDTLGISMDQLCRGANPEERSVMAPDSSQKSRNIFLSPRNLLLMAVSFLIGFVLCHVIGQTGTISSSESSDSFISCQTVLDSITSFTHHDDGGHWGEGYGQTLCILPNAAPQGLQMQLKLVYKDKTVAMNPILIQGVPKDGHFIFDVTSVPYSESFSVHVIVQLGDAIAEHSLYQWLIVSPGSMAWSY